MSGTSGSIDARERHTNSRMVCNPHTSNKKWNISAMDGKGERAVRWPARRLTAGKIEDAPLSGVEPVSEYPKIDYLKYS